MKLKPSTVHLLADMVTGGSGSMGPNDEYAARGPFRYRRGNDLTTFFVQADTEHVHDGTSRVPWAKDVLAKINEELASNPELPSDSMIRVLQELMDAHDYQDSETRQQALTELAKALQRDGLEPYFDDRGQCQVRAGAASSATLSIEQKAWTAADTKRREEWQSRLQTLSEDDFTDNVLVPLLKQCGFQRVEQGGHREKILEFGRDVWMKFRLPTGHWLYFGIQVKVGKLDTSGRSKGSNENAAEVLNQVQMALGAELFDSDINRKVLVDHVYVICTGGITRAASQYIAGHLDSSKRRSVILMQLPELLELLVRTQFELPSDDDSIPF